MTPARQPEAIDLNDDGQLEILAIYSGQGELPGRVLIVYLDVAS